MLPRSKLHEALVHAGLDPSITWTIMNIHESARMQFKHGEHQVSIGTTNGVRQGCGLAPSLWTLFTCLILEKLALRIPLQCITAYADDLLILGLRGQQARTVLQHMTTRDPRKGRLFRIRLPMVRQHTYLGVQLSYERFEHQTLLDRIKHCWTAFNRLLPAFRSKGLTNAQKLRIWKACPFASLLHGLDCAQLDNADQARLRKHVVRQLRILDKAPSFITRESAGDLLHRLAIPEPLQTLQNRTLDRVTKCLEEPKASLLEPATRRRLQQLQSFTQACQEASQRSATGATPHLHPAAENAQPVACPDCGLYFDSVTSMRKHRTQKHKPPAAEHQRHTDELDNPVRPASPKESINRSQQSLRLDFMQHALDGMPTCRYCRWEFSAWPWFLQHFEKKRCRVLHAPHLVQTSLPTGAETQPVTGTGTAVVESAHPLANLPEGLLQQNQINETVSLSPAPDNASPSPAQLPNLDIQRCLLRVPADLLQTATEGDWRQLSRQIRQTDQNYCLFCGQWLARPTYLSRHIQSQHQCLLHVQTALDSWLEARHTALSSPCEHCHTDFKVRHISRLRHARSCITLYRTGLLILLARTQAAPQSEELALNEQQQQEIISANDQIKLMRSMMGVPPGMLAVSEARLPFGTSSQGARLDPTQKGPTPHSVPVPAGETPLQTDEDEAPLDCLRENPPAPVTAATSTETAPIHTATREGKRGDRDREVDSGTSQGKGTQKFQRGDSKGRGGDPTPSSGNAPRLAGGRTKAGGSKAAGTPRTAAGATSLARIAAKARARGGARAMARSRPRSSRNASCGNCA